MARASNGFGSGLDPASKGAGTGEEITPCHKENSIDLGGSGGLVGGSQTAGNVKPTKSEDQSWYMKGAGVKYTK